MRWVDYILGWNKNSPTPDEQGEPTTIAQESRPIAYYTSLMRRSEIANP
ncbi:MAG: hypothetical protein P8P30_00670 [Rickettsiales bacterium]|nr:hypothetical protein [Rickettsiales bacterium]